MSSTIAILNGGLHEEQVFSGEPGISFHYSGDLSSSPYRLANMLRNPIVIIPFHLDQILLSRYKSYFDAYIRNGGILVILGANQDSGRTWIPHVQWDKVYPCRIRSESNNDDSNILLNDLDPAKDLQYHGGASHGIISPGILDDAQGDSVVAEGYVTETESWQPIFVVKRSGISGTLLVTTIDPDFHASTVPCPADRDSEELRRNAQILLHNILVWARKEATFKTLLSINATPFIRDVRDEIQMDVAIITALESPEMDAVIAAGGGKENWNTIVFRDDPNHYLTTDIITSSSQSITVVAATPDRTGLTASSILTTKVLNIFRPKLLMIVGIAAGFQSADVAIGDILVANPAIDYGSGKIAIDEDGNEVFIPSPYPVDLPTRVRELLNRCRREGLFLREIHNQWNGKKPREIPDITIGPLGSGDLVIDSPRKVSEIEGLWRKIIGVEMEVYSVYQACRQAQYPNPDFLSLKAVCDKGQEKSDDWQHYAAFVSAQYAFSLIKGPLQTYLMEPI